MDDIIFENVPKMKTPVGEFRVTTDDGEEVLFSVQKNSFNLPYDIFDSVNSKKLGSISAETNFTILIPTAGLTVGKEYTVSFTNGNWSYCDSNEHAICYSAYIDDWVVGIGTFAPNNDKENKETSLDESNLPHYTTEGLDDFTGFKFKLTDSSSLEFVPFDIAWLKVDMLPATTYMSALGFWLC